MQKTVQIKLMPSFRGKQALNDETHVYIKTVNRLVRYILENQEYRWHKKYNMMLSGPLALSSSQIVAPLNSSVKNEAIRQAQSIVKKYNKTDSNGVVPFLRKPIVQWNNQNWTFDETSISMPFIVDGKSQKLTYKALITPRQYEYLTTHKLGSLRLTEKNHKWIAQIAVECDTPEEITGGQVIGIDLGIKVPAVVVCEDGSTQFIGNGRKNKYMRRCFNSKRKTLGKAKKRKAYTKSQNKEQRVMKDLDHKYSRKIIDFAKAHKVFIIRLEDLQGIRQSTSTSRKNNHSLSSWSFYRLAQYIEYKAWQAGIKVEYVNPYKTSQRCPKCGAEKHANDRHYHCASCGYDCHRDRIGAINIITAPVLSGKRKAA